MISSRDEKDDVELTRLCSTLFNYTHIHVHICTNMQNQGFWLISAKCTVVTEKLGLRQKLR